jgi:hypothetical protein
MKKRKSQNQPLTLHNLLVALSFWGTSVRLLLFLFLAAAVFIAALSETSTAAAVDTEIMTLIYVIGSFLVLDFGYVTIARAYVLQKGLDMLALLVADSIVMLLYIVPNLVVSDELTRRHDPLTFIVFVPLIVLTMRTLLGMLYGTRSKE